MSADTVVPGAADGAGSGLGMIGYDERTRLTPLTVAFHEPEFLEVLNGENGELLQFGPPALWDGQVRREHNVPLGPANPQALNRYAYCLGNPVRFTDPSGHAVPILLVMGLFAGVGAIASGVGYVAVQAAFGQPIDRTELGVAMLVGFVAGGVTPLIPCAGGLIALGAGANVAQYALSNWLTGNEVTGRGMAVSALTGALGGLVPGGSSAPIDDFLSEASMAGLRNLLGQSDIHKWALNRALMELYKEGFREFIRSALGEAAVESLDQLLIPEPRAVRGHQ